MPDLNAIREHMDVIGADGVHVGTVDHLEGKRIKLTKADSGKAPIRAITTTSRPNSWPASRATRFASRRTPTSP